MKYLGIRGVERPVLVLILVSFFLLLVGFIYSLLSQGNMQSISYFIYYTILIFMVFFFSIHGDYLSPVFIISLLSLVFGGLGSYTVLVEGIVLHRDLIYGSYQSIDSAVSKKYILESFYMLVLFCVYLVFPRGVVFFNQKHREDLFSKDLLMVCVFWGVLSVVAFLLYAQQSGGFLEAITQRSLSREMRVSNIVGGHYTYIINNSYIAPLVWLLFSQKATRSMVFWFVLIITVTTSFFVTGSRGGLLTKGIIILMAYLIHAKKIPVKAIFISLGVLLILIGIMSENRTKKIDVIQEMSLHGYLSSSAQGIVKTFEEASRRGSENDSSVGVYLNVPSNVSYQFGMTYLSVPFVFIPSALLPFEKPSAAGYYYVNQLTGRTDTAWPIGSIAEAYWNFSYVGVVLIAVISAVVYKMAYSTLLANKYSALSMVFYLAVVFRFSVGSDQLYSFFHFLVFALIVYFSYVVYGRIRLASFKC